MCNKGYSLSVVAQAWSGVKEGVHVSSVSLSTASLAAQQTASGLKEAASGLKDRLSKGKRLLQQALAAGDAPEEQVRPNRALGGALGIHLCGVLMPRLPNPDEDADPLLQV
jgi:hypothetical protein